MATNMDEEQSLRECEAYVQMHGLFLAKQIIVKILPLSETMYGRI